MPGIYEARWVVRPSVLNCIRAAGHESTRAVLAKSEHNAVRFISNLNQHPESRKRGFAAHLWPPTSLDRSSVDEWWVLLEFLRAAGFLSDEAPKKLVPPSPDFECIVDGKKRLFELGEVLDSSLAEGLAFSAKEAQRKSDALADGAQADAESIDASGCRSFSANGSLLRMLGKKLTTKYIGNGIPSDLLLFYDQQSPYGPCEFLFECAAQFVPLMAGSSFENTWLFHLPTAQVMGRASIGNTGELQIACDYQFAFDKQARFQAVVPGSGDEPDRLQWFEPALYPLRIPKK